MIKNEKKKKTHNGLGFENPKLNIIKAFYERSVVRWGGEGGWGFQKVSVFPLLSSAQVSKQPNSKQK